MTWIKPSFNWMMYRSGYATKFGQEVILGIDITRAGFEWALKNSTLSGFNPAIHNSPEKWKYMLQTKPVRIQWDPERNWRLDVIEGVRSIQIGLSGEAVERYVSEWIVNIEDMTPMARQVADAVATRLHPNSVPDLLERPYPIDSSYSHILAHTP